MKGNCKIYKIIDKKECSTVRYKGITVMNFLDIVRSLTFPNITGLEYYEATRNELIRGSYPEIEEIAGDIFTADNNWAFAYCTSEDFAMTTGIAGQFRERYGNVAFLREQNAMSGYVAVQNHFEPNDTQGRFIFCLITKAMFSQKPCFYHVFCSLYRLRKICEALNVTRVAMAPIESADLMEYRFVKHMIYTVFKRSNILIRIYSK